MTESRDTVLIIGSGMMGAGIAAKSAAAGRRTVLADTALDYAQRGVETAKEKLAYLREKELLSDGDLKRGEGLLEATADYRAERERTFLVIEAVTEDLNLKRKIFAGLDLVFPEDIPIASNTSGLRITDIARDMKHPRRAITTHFWFPAHLVPLVEVVIGDQTLPALAKQVKEELLLWGKAPVIVKKDLPGQLANRILQAVIREAVNIVDMDLASAEDVDTAVKMGMGIRFPVWGPLEHVDAVGLDLCKNVQDTVLPAISRSTAASPRFEKLIGEDCVGVKTGRGFYDWQVKDHERLRTLRDDFIVEAVRFLKKEAAPSVPTENSSEPDCKSEEG